MPTSQPSSHPSHFFSIWNIQVDNITDFSVNDVTQIDSYCVAKEWTSAQPTGICNLRAAILFCQFRFPWLSGLMKACNVHLPNNSVLNFPLAELNLFVPISNFSNIPMSINIYGGGSKCVGSMNSRFLTTVPLDLNVYTSMSLNPSTTASGQSRRQLSSIGETSLTSVLIRDLMLKSFGSASISGGCMNIQNLKTFSLDNVTISDSAGNYGGALYAADVGVVTISSSTFISNIASNGGSLAIFNSQTLIIESSEISNNFAKNIGGGFVIDSVAHVIIDNNVMNENSASNFGGAASFYSVIGSVDVKSCILKANAAKFGSAIILSKCSLSSVFGNVFEYNRASQAGTIFWTAATMAEPKGVFNNSFANNSVMYYGMKIATETFDVKASASLVLDDYNPADYPLHPKVWLSDYYNQIVSSESGTTIEAVITSERKKFCSFNSKRAGLRGGVIAFVVNGFAQFKFMSALCIPGGHMNITFATQVNSFSATFPLYDSTVRTISPKFTKSLQTDIKLTFRTCRRGEIFDFFSTASMCTLCVNGFSVADSSDNTVITCLPCPAAAQSCSGSNIYLYPGTWRWTSDSMTILSCPFAAGCLGGNSSGAITCDQGYSGPACGICLPGYYSSARTCRPCDGQQSITPSVIVFYIMLSLVGLSVVGYVLYIFFFTTDKDFTSLTTSARHAQISTVSTFHRYRKGREFEDETSELERKVEERKREQQEAFISRMKTCVVTFQIVSQGSGNLDVKFPPMFSSTLSVIGNLNFDLGSLLPINCTSLSPNFLQQMAITTFSPIFMWVILISVFGVHWSFTTKKFKKNTRKLKDSHYILLIRYFSFALLIIYFLLPSVCLKVFQVFDCIDVDPAGDDPQGARHRVLRYDYSVDCYSTSYLSWSSYAVVMIFVYPVGVSLLYAYLLISNRHLIKSRDDIGRVMNSSGVSYRKYSKFRSKPHIAQCIGFFYLAYKPKYWYWELVEIFRRVGMEAALAVFLRGTTAQIIVGILASLAFMKIYSTCQPSSDEYENSLNEIGMNQVFLTYYAASILKQKSFDDIKFAYSLMDWTLIIVNFSVVVANIYYTYLSYFPAEHKDKDEKKEQVSRYTVKKILKTKWNFKFGNDILRVKGLLNACKDEDILLMQRAILWNIIAHKRSSSHKYVFFVPICNLDRTIENFDRGVNSFEHVDIEAGVTYLMVPRVDLEVLDFVVPVMQTIDGNLIASSSSSINIAKKGILLIPPIAFDLSNYKKPRSLESIFNSLAECNESDSYTE